jgi:hypothetical protein
LKKEKGKNKFTPKYAAYKKKHKNKLDNQFIQENAFSMITVYAVYFFLYSHSPKFNSILHN